jgi:UDP-N-acetylmuramoyl-L-alanyl-D-glutamate--2,6-diaminopimelate ligase
MPQLSTWARDLDLEHLSGAADPSVYGVTSDSREVHDGDVFVAIHGTRQDGASFVGEALRRGAVAVVGDESLRVPAEAGGCAFFRSADPRRVLARLARERHGRPDLDLRMLAVTGTNGKTTVSWLAARYLELRGERAGCLGTIRYRTGRRDEPARWTTPPPEPFFELLAEMRDAGCGACSLEASSHALDQCRLGEAEIDVAAFTNLTREHLEYHANLEEYLAAKRRLLEHLRSAGRTKPEGRAVVNVDDAVFGGCDWPADTIRVGRQEGVEVRLLRAAAGRDGIDLELDYADSRLRIRNRLLGDYNVENLLVLAGMARALRAPVDEVESHFARLDPVPGRLERVELGGEAPLVLIDYAHTPDALRSVTRSVRELTPGRLRVVFGCGGDRDRGKRPEMAGAVVEVADEAYLTLDNPRTEDPERIFADASAAFVGHEDRAFVVPDRSEALATALRRSTIEDTLLVTGKGHETYQIIGDEKLPWDDREVLAEAWRSMDRGPRG